jgi:2-iminobutanoate/2-iminopropanoate deaminase
MTREIIRTGNAPGFPMYSQAVKAAGLVFVSGQGPYDPASGEVCGDTIQQQTHQALRNVSAILEAAGSSLAKVVSVTFLLGDEADFGGLNEEWVKWFPVDPPARQGARLPARPKNIRISIAVVAEA